MPARIRRLWNLLRRHRIDDELRQEIETHLALLEEFERRQGAGVEQARRDARARFGHPDAYRARAVDAVIATSLDGMVREIVFASRRLVRSPAFTIASVLTLALAMGANVAVFAIVERVVINPLPYPDSDSIVQLDHGSQRLNFPGGFGITPGLYYQYAERSRSFEAVAIYQTDGVTLTGDGDPARIRIARVTPSLLAVARIAPALGRWFGDGDGAPGAAPVGILSNGLWTRRFKRDATVLGRTVLLGGVPTQIVGVMPAGFAFPDPGVELWTPVQLARAMGFGLWAYQGVARLRDGATAAGARREMEQLISDVPRAFPGDPGALGNVQTHLIARVQALKEAIVGGVEKALWTLLAAIGVVLLIAYANVTNLFLVRSEIRQREVAIRGALGAGRVGIVRFFLAESVLLSLIGGLLAMAIAGTAVRLLVAFGPATLPRLNEIRIDAATLLYAVALCAAATVMFSVIPVWRSRATTMTLGERGRGAAAASGRHRVRRLLMGAQVALALVLLIASTLIARSFQNIRAVDPGFDPRGALTFGIGLSDRDYPTRERDVAAHQRILDGLRALPGVSAVSASTCLPLGGGCFGNTVRVLGRELPPDAVPPISLFRAVAADYFETMGMRRLRGRGIDRQDVDRAAPIVVVDQTFVDRFFPNQDPVGQYVASNRPARRPGEQPDLVWREIVGVVSSTPVFTPAEAEPRPQLYMPMSIAAPLTGKVNLVGPDLAVMNYVVRTSRPPESVLPAVRRIVDTVDPAIALAQVQTLQQILDRSSAQMQLTMTLLTVAAGVALVLGLVGIYGVMSYIVTQRRAEIGVRLALGAEPRSVTGMILAQGALVTTAGLAAGLLIAAAASRVIQSLLYRVTARDPAIFAVTTLALFGIALIACWLPARRAARLNPMTALRQE